MEPINNSKSANEVIHGIAALRITPSQPTTVDPRPGLHVAARSAVGIDETSAKHTQSSPLRPSTQTTEATMPGTSSSPAGPKVSTTSLHPSRTQEAESFRQTRRCPHPFPGHYKTHRHHPISQAARARLSESYPPTTTHQCPHKRNRHQALMRMGDIDHPLSDLFRQRMKLQQIREHRRVLLARLRDVEAGINAHHMQSSLESLSSLSLTGESERLSVAGDEVKHATGGSGEMPHLGREEATVGDMGEDLDGMEE